MSSTCRFRARRRAVAMSSSPGTLVPAGQQHDHRAALLPVVHPVARSVVDPQFRYALADGSDVSGVSGPPDARPGRGRAPGHGYPAVRQATWRRPRSCEPRTCAQRSRQATVRQLLPRVPRGIASLPPSRPRSGPGPAITPHVRDRARRPRRTCQGPTPRSRCTDEPPDPAATPGDKREARC